ncbi:glycosyltransferase [Naasia lichenicola]|uniref:glycosyltransferase n=1 Tax=Naasia lichenicola TaxID=2565933 RepID=UPI001E56069B|nr:glycosyltransferase [Naasia lichenicola]
MARRTLLIISPDYASHLLPLASLGTAWRDAGDRVVVATGASTASIVEGFGFERRQLQLGKGSNPGVIRAEEQQRGEDEALRGFFAATRQGMIDTLAFQARARLSDLMWEPARIAREVQAIVEDLHPDAIIVDHLAFSARLALVAMGAPYADVVLGHPTALPVGSEIYGYPPVWPREFAPDDSELAELRDLCLEVSAHFTAEWNGALAEVNPDLPPVVDAFAEHGDLLLLNYPGELSDPERTAILPPHEFLGSAVREEPEDLEVAAWLAEAGPFVYVSFGSFLSVRADVLARVIAALESLGLRAAIALGSADRAELGEIPDGWLAREYLPQVTLLARASLAITHGGNNSVTEAMTYGVPLLVLPFSTDQFAAAEALERVGFGQALAPNAASVDELAAAIGRIIDLPGEARARLDGLSASLRDVPGRDRAYAALARLSARP